jgi:SNF2 family DNA or RNA helicase
LEACLERIHEAVDGEHRVLVYSQFVSFLAFVRSELEQREVRYCYLDGTTRDRAGEIAKFRKGDAPLFLISLKAGGTGLNLTEADTVMLLDPWWNPAVESQALARAHRIGQERPVTTYRFITRGSVEEKIQKLQQSKAELAAGALAGSGAAVALTVEEMEALLRE